MRSFLLLLIFLLSYLATLGTLFQQEGSIRRGTLFHALVVATLFTILISVLSYSTRNKSKP